MFYGSYVLNNEKHAGIYHDPESWYRDTWSPLTENIVVIPFDIHGRDYKSRKESARSVAVEWSAYGEAWPLSWGELQTVCDWFYINGMRYGLLREFMENGLC